MDFKCTVVRIGQPTKAPLNHARHRCGFWAKKFIGSLTSPRGIEALVRARDRPATAVRTTEASGMLDRASCPLL